MNLPLPIRYRDRHLAQIGLGTGYEDQLERKRRIVGRAFLQADAGAEVPDGSRTMDGNGFLDWRAAVLGDLEFEAVVGCCYADHRRGFAVTLVSCAERIGTHQDETRGYTHNDSSHVRL